MQKTIYVRDEDAQVFARAEELSDGDSLSAVIVKALRGFIQDAEDQAEGWEKYELRPYRSGETVSERGRAIKFTGYEITDHQIGTIRDGGREQLWTVYLTKAGKIILSYERKTIWQGECDYMNVHVFDTFENFKSQKNYDGEIPETLIVDVEEYLTGEAAIYID